MLENDEELTNFKPKILKSIYVEGQANPKEIGLGKRVELTFTWSPSFGDWFIDSCTAKGGGDELVLLRF